MSSEPPPFHSTCLYPRSIAYKYRNLSTSTGESTFHDLKEQHLFETKLQQIQREINSKIDCELEKNSIARDAMLNKFERISGKIESIVELQNNVLGMKHTLKTSEKFLRIMTDKVNKIEMFLDNDYMKDGCNLIFTKNNAKQTSKSSELEVEEMCMSLTENNL